MAERPYSLRNLTTGLAKELTLKNIKKLLDPARKIPDKIIEISILDINYFKDLDDQECKTINEIFGVKTIRELADVTYRQLVENATQMREKGISQEKLELMITSAKYITNAARYRIPEGQKIVFVGLDNAGKTALINAINKEMMEETQIKPTQGMQRQTIFLKDQKIYIYELGGQELFRKMYLRNPERYILGTDIIVFLIDMQDQQRYEISLEYLTQILNIVKYLNENPEFIVLLHKSDPEILKVQLFYEKIDYIKEKVGEIFQSYSFQYSIHISSIYNILSLSKSFQSLIKNLLTGDLEREQESRAAFKLISRLIKMLLNIESELTNELSILSENFYEMKEELHLIKKLILSGEIETLKETLSTKEDIKSALEKDKSLVSSREMLLEELRQFLIKK